MCDVFQRKIHVISLKRREDRRRDTLQTCETVALEPVFFDAIEDPIHGILGCAKSHAAVLEQCLEREPDALYYAIAEDDIQFRCDGPTLDAHVQAFVEDRHAEILSIGNNTLRKVRHSDLLDRALNTQTMSFYIVKHTIAKILLQNLRQGISMYEKKPCHEHCNDIYWKKLQGRHVFVVPKQRLAVQRPSYSDIEKRDVDYQV